MPVVPPPSRPQIHLHISLARGVVPKSQKRSSKIRSRFMIPKPWMQHLYWLAISRPQIFPHDPLMKPDRLQQLLRRHRNILAQFSQTAPPPLRVKIDPGAEHDDLLFQASDSKVKAPLKPPPNANNLQ